MYTQQLIEGQYFHIYNRGVNGENLFREEKTITIFLNSTDITVLVYWKLLHIAC